MSLIFISSNIFQALFHIRESYSFPAHYFIWRRTSWCKFNSFVIIWCFSKIFYQRFVFRVQSAVSKTAFPSTHPPTTQKHCVPKMSQNLSKKLPKIARYLRSPLRSSPHCKNISFSLTQLFGSLALSKYLGRSLMDGL